jgi:Gamma-glutamyl cyclotransferase, AIG2-like
MTTFFFYGTLLDHDVMAVVIGRRLPPSAFVPARLRGHVRRRAKGVSYPIVQRDPGGEVEGVIVGGLTKHDVERLSIYEGPRYRIAPLKVMVGGAVRTVSVFEPKEASFQPADGAWDLALWQGRYKRPFIARIRKALSALPAYSRR